MIPPFDCMIPGSLPRPAREQFVSEIADIPFHHWLERGVHRRRQRPFVLADLREDVARQRQGEIDTFRSQEVAHSPFVLGVLEGIQQTDRDALGVAFPKRLGDRSDAIFVQIGEDRPRSSRRSRTSYRRSRGTIGVALST
jgi:hypothetical protein